MSVQSGGVDDFLAAMSPFGSAAQASSAGPSPGAVAATFAATNDAAAARAPRTAAIVEKDASKDIEDTVTVPNTRDGEIVRLREMENDDESDMMRVTFKTKYTRPTDTPEEIIDAKKVFSAVFKQGTKFISRKPKPPCDQDQYLILKRGWRGDVRLLERIWRIYG